MKIGRIYIYFDVALAFACATAPIQTIYISEWLLALGHMGAYINAPALHALTIAGGGSICGFLRNDWDEGRSVNRLKRLALDVIIVGVFLSVVYKVNISGEVDAAEVVTPYIQYLISIFFCLGAGYALSDAFKNTIS